MVHMQSGPFSIHAESTYFCLSPPIHLQGQLLASSALSLPQQLRHLPVLKTGSLSVHKLPWLLPVEQKPKSFTSQSSLLFILWPVPLLDLIFSQTPHSVPGTFFISGIFLMFS